jgi:outer membrane lipoprotein-sorting protein
MIPLLKILRTASILVLFFSQHLFGAELLSTDELKELQRKMKSASQLSVDFVQTKTVHIRPKKPSRSEGKAIFSKPTKFRWELYSPPSLTVFDGSNLFEINTSSKVATRYKAAGSRVRDLQEVIDLVLDFDSLLSRYKIVEASKIEKSILLKLSPFSKESGISGIDIALDAASASIKVVSLSFTNKNVSKFEFSNPNRNPVSPLMFQVPPGIKVIDGL